MDTTINNLIPSLNVGVNTKSNTAHSSNSFLKLLQSPYAAQSKDAGAMAPANKDSVNYEAYKLLNPHGTPDDLLSEKSSNLKNVLDVQNDLEKKAAIQKIFDQDQLPELNQNLTLNNKINVEEISEKIHSIALSKSNHAQEINFSTERNFNGLKTAPSKVVLPNNLVYSYADINNHRPNLSMGDEDKTYLKVLSKNHSEVHSSINGSKSKNSVEEIYEQKFYATGKLSYISNHNCQHLHSKAQPIAASVEPIHYEPFSIAPLGNNGAVVVEHSLSIDKGLTKLKNDDVHSFVKTVEKAAVNLSRALNLLEERKISIIKETDSRHLVVRDYKSASYDITSQITEILNSSYDYISKITLNGKEYR